MDHLDQLLTDFLREHFEWLLVAVGLFITAWASHLMRSGDPSREFHGRIQFAIGTIFLLWACLYFVPLATP